MFLLFDGLPGFSLFVPGSHYIFTKTLYKCLIRCYNLIVRLLLMAVSSSYQFNNNLTACITRAATLSSTGKIFTQNGGIYAKSHY